MLIGIDPGGRETGIVLLNGDKDLVRACVVTRDGSDSLPDSGYLAEILEVAAEYLDLEPGPQLVTVETLVNPTGQLGRINVMGILGAAIVLGSILTVYPTCITVPPGGNGSGPMGSYPKDIQAKPGGKGADRMRHARSAYDVAIRGWKLAR